jgi:lipopolysaccharide heptosyltransferase I
MQLDKLADPRIAIIKLSSLGDVLHALPVLCGLKKQLPRSRISWLVEPQFQELLLGHEDLEQVITLDTKTWRRQLKDPSQFRQGWQALCRARQRLRGCKFDLALDLQGLFKSGLATLATGAATRLGFHPRACREPIAALFTSQWVRPAEGVHVIEKNLTFLKHLGLDASTVQFKLPVSAAARQWAGEWLEQRFASPQRRPLVVIHPGSRWPSKCWPKQRYIQLIKLLQQRRVDILLSGGPGEGNLLAEINPALPQALGFSLAHLMALLERCDLMVASDTGPLHLAAALGRPTVAFYGPTPYGPGRNGPYGPGHIIFDAQLPCSGCGHRDCADLKCMQAISVPEVLGAVIYQLKKE